MKKHIPHSLLNAAPLPKRTHPPVATAYDSATSDQSRVHSAPIGDREPVTIDDLINSIAQRNIDAMSPARAQKKHNKAALNSVLSSIFSSK